MGSSPAPAITDHSEMSGFLFLFETAYNEGNFKNKGGVTMCDVVERIENRGKADIIRKVLDAKALTVEQIADILKLPVEEVKKIAQMVPVLN